ncbi:9776_t:CDS:2, partial [Ambispora leptoticha]
FNESRLIQQQQTKNDNDIMHQNNWMTSAEGKVPFLYDSEFGQFDYLYNSSGSSYGSDNDNGTVIHSNDNSCAVIIANDSNSINNDDTITTSHQQQDMQMPNLHHNMSNTKTIIPMMTKGPQRPIDGGLKVAEIIALGIETLEKHGIRYVPGSLPGQIGILDTFENKMAISVQKNDDDAPFYEKIYGNVIDNSSISEKGENKKFYFGMGEQIKNRQNLDETCARTRCDRKSLVSESYIDGMNEQNPFIEIMHSEEFLTTKKEWKSKEKKAQKTRTKYREKVEKVEKGEWQTSNNHINDFGNLRSTNNSTIDLPQKQLKKPNETFRDRMMSRLADCEAIIDIAEKNRMTLLSSAVGKVSTEKLHERISLSPLLQTAIKKEIVETPFSLMNTSANHQMGSEASTDCEFLL